MGTPPHQSLPQFCLAQDTLSKRADQVLLGFGIHPPLETEQRQERLRTEQQLLDQLPKLPDLQCAWLLLRLCASPRANHAIRTMPPSQSAAYASAHDAAVWATLQAFLGGPSERDNGLAREVAALPAALAKLTAPAACWAAWAAALPAIRDRLPGCAESYIVMFEADAEDAAHCLAEAARARRTLQDESWSECPTWRAVLEGARPAHQRKTRQSGGASLGPHRPRSSRPRTGPPRKVFPASASTSLPSTGHHELFLRPASRELGVCHAFRDL